MILTGKALEDFETWVNWKYPNIEVLLLGVVESVFLNALIIEFFDSVGIYVNVELNYLHLVWFPSINNNWAFEEVEFETRQEAIEEAIKKANETYNNK